jgi:glycosyltransferase involved in cell wall biosynthesis
MAPLRITMVGPFGLRPKGTMAVRALPLAKALAARGHQVKLIMPPWHTPSEPPRLWREDEVELEYVALGPLRGHASVLWIAQRMARAALSWCPDVVHGFKPKAYAGLALWALWQQRSFIPGGPALIVDEDDWEGRGGWEQREPYSGPQRAFFRWQEGWGLAHNDGVTVASRALETLAWSLGTPPQQVLYLPNGSTLARPAQRAAPGQPTLLLYTRFAEFDPPRAVDVLARIAERVPGVRLRVVGAALHPEQDVAFARAVAARGLAAQVERLGWLPPEELPEALSACQVAFVPADDNLINRCRCSVKLADLLQLSVPTVADRVGEAESYLIDGESGYLTAPGDVDAMADRVVRLLTDSALAARMGQAAQARYDAFFDWSRLAERVEGFYARALARRSTT